MNELITEDFIIDWVRDNKGLLVTRKLINITEINISDIKMVCLTGYQTIIDNFFDKLIDNIREKVVLIIIETDEFVLKDEYLNNEKIKHVFCWNKPINHEKITAIPIGLNYSRQHDSICSWLTNNSIRGLSERKLLCINYTENTNSIRGMLLEKARNNWADFCDIISYIPNERTYFKHSNIERGRKIKVDVTNKIYYDMINNYKFILSPPGAGMDCHRTWEAVYMGCIPIVIKSNIDELYKDLPIVILDSWNDLSKELLERKYNEIKERLDNKTFNIERVYLSYWLKKISLLVNEGIFAYYYNRTRVINFVTYGNDKFKEAKKRILKEAYEFGVFNMIRGYGPEDLPNDFYEKNKGMLTDARGGGYWIWRPLVLIDMLNNMNMGDYLVYLDAGCKINPLGINRFNEYIDMLDNSNYGILSFQMTGYNGIGNLEIERKWTIKEIFQFFNVDINSTIATSGQYLGGVLVMKKNEHLMNYINEYSNIVLNCSVLCSDNFNNVEQHDDFKENRHEQSISSVLRKLLGSVVVNCDESYIKPFGKGKSLYYPFWATRSNT